MTLPNPTIRIFFGLEYSTGLFFTLDDPVKGVLDNSTYLLASDDGNGVDITDGFDMTIRRGRNRELDEFQAGTCTVSLRNFTRAYDALNAASPYFGDLVPGKRVQILIGNTIIYAGIIEDWNLEWDVGGDAVATFTALDALGQLARKEFDAWTTTNGQTAGPRIASALDRPEVAFGANRSLSTGQSTLQGDTVTWSSNVLNYLQLVAKSDFGRLFASRENVLTFKDRHALVTSTVVASFSDDGTDIPFHGIGTEVGAELLYNRVGVDRAGGTLQTVGDTASQNAYGVRALSLPGLLMDSDAQSLAMAEFVCSVYKDPKVRVSELVVNVSDDINLTAAEQAAVVRLEIGDLIDVTWTPVKVGSAVTQQLVVEGIDHDISLEEHIVTLHTAPPSQSGVFILDDPLWGVMDTGPGALTF